jgi:hypothetical protein
MVERLSVDSSCSTRHNNTSLSGHSQTPFVVFPPPHIFFSSFCSLHVDVVTLALVALVVVASNR